MRVHFFGSCNCRGGSPSAGPKPPAAVHPDGVVNSSWNGGTGIWDVKVDWT
jgi:hypothetical protein